MTFKDFERDLSNALGRVVKKSKKGISDLEHTLGDKFQNISDSASGTVHTVYGDIKDSVTRVGDIAQQGTHELGKAAGTVSKNLQMPLIVATLLGGAYLISQ